MENASKKTVSKQFKFVLGIVVTALLLALIAIIVVIAVRTATGVSYLYSYKLLWVDDTVYDGRYIAVRANGTYSLMNGDAEQRGGYAYLERQADGHYLYITSDGDYGGLDRNGDRLGEVEGGELLGSTRHTYTVSGEDGYRTYLWSGEHIAQLDGKNTFGYFEGSYCYTADGVLYFDDGSSYTGELDGYYLALAADGRYLLSNGTHGVLLSGGSAKSGELHSEHLQIGDEYLWYFTLGGERYGYDLAPAQFFGSTATEILQVLGGYYYISGGSVYDNQGTQLFSGGATSFINEQYVLCGSAVASITDGLIISGVSAIVSEPTAAAEDTLFLTGGGLYSLDGLIADSGTLENYGGYLLGGKVKKLDGGYAVPCGSGIYFTGEEGGLVSCDSYAMLGGDLIAVASDSKLTVIGWDGRPVQEEQYTAPLNYAVTAVGDGYAVVQTSNGYGLLNPKGKMVIKPFYNRVELDGDFVFVQNKEGVWAIAGLNGNFATGFEFSARPIALGKYVLADNFDGTQSLLGEYGSVVLEKVYGYAELSVISLQGLAYEHGEYKMVRLATDGGYRILRINERDRAQQRSRRYA